MTKKISKFDLAMMKAAQVWSALSYCNRKKVGAVLSKDNRIISCGYNGTLQNTPNHCEDTEGNTNEFVVHAEQNVLMFCSRNGIATEGCSLYITLSPCKNCAKLVASAGISEVFFLKEYKDTSGVLFLQELGINVQQLSV